jgi:ABC-type dipeptide/oligopeptide/nickel transport system permease component
VGIAALIVRRVLVSIPVAFAVLVITFAMIRLVPGGPVDVIAGTTITPEVAAELKQELGLDKPLPTQFFDYVDHVLHGNLGTSFVTREPVSQIVEEHLPYTLELTGLGLLIGIVLALPLGIFAAIRHSAQRGSGLGFILGTTTMAATPDFLLGTILAAVFAVNLRWLPVAGAHGWKSIILPALALGLPLAGIQARVVRSSVSDQINRQFVRTLRAAGVRERRLMLRNVLPNASIPVLTLLTVEFGRLLGGALVVENVFAWPGLGTEIFNSISNRDLPAVQGELLVLALVILGTNLVVDVLYRVIDPRIGAS